jgi:hypothetical protein
MRRKMIALSKDSSGKVGFGLLRVQVSRLCEYEKKDRIP